MLGLALLLSVAAPFGIAALWNGGPELIENDAETARRFPKAMELSLSQINPKWFSDSVFRWHRLLGDGKSIW